VKEYAELVRLYAQYHAEMAKEEYLTGVGLKGTCDTAAISARYESLLTRRTYDSIIEMAKRSRSASNKERYLRMSWAIMEAIVGSECPDDDYTNAMLKARAMIDGARVRYNDIDGMIDNEPDPERREMLTRTMVRISDRSFNPLLKEQQEGRLGAYRKFSKFLNLREYAAEVTLVDFDRLHRALSWLIVRSEDRFRELMGAFVQERLGRPWKGLMGYAHSTHLYWRTDLDDHFRKETLIETCSRTFAELGLHFSETKGLFLDTEDRPNKEYRASCSPVRVPDEVRLSIRPTGGLGDYKDFLHECGHSWQYALTDPKLPFEFKLLSRSDALTETYAFLFERLVHDPRWLTDIAGLKAKDADRLVRLVRMHDLHNFRSYIAQFFYELEHATHPTDHEWNRKRFVKLVTDLTGFETTGTGFLSDIDGAVQSADYIRAWIGEAHLRAYLRKQFGEDWFRKREAGEYLRGLWRKGESIELPDLLNGIGADAYDVSPLLARYDEV